MASESLGWLKEETRFPLEGRLQFTQPPDTNWKRPFTGKFTAASAVLAVQSAEDLPQITAGGKKELIFPQDTAGIKDANLMLLRDKSGSKPCLARVRTSTRHDFSFCYLNVRPCVKPLG